MYRELYGLTEWINENDFIKRKINNYAVINDEYFMKIKRKKPDELSSIEGVFSFYFCRVRKTGDKEFKIEGRGITHKIYDDCIPASQYISMYDGRDESVELVKAAYDRFGEYALLTNTYIDKDGFTHRFVSPLYDNEFLISKPKKLSLKN